MRMSLIVCMISGLVPHISIGTEVACLAQELQSTLM